MPTGGSAEFTFNGTAGQAVMVFVDGDTTTTGTSIPDIVLELYGPTNVAAGNEGHGHEPRVHRAGTAGHRHLSRPWSSASCDGRSPSGGDFRYEVSNADLPEAVLSDYNLLFFLSTGAVHRRAGRGRTRSRIVRSSWAASMPPSAIQLVIVSRATRRRPAAMSRTASGGWASATLSPQEYTSYLDPVTYGHNSAAGAIGVAAYPFFAPFVPEAFTSPGPSTIYFDKDSKRLRHVEVRQKPDLAAMDGANTTFFTSDTANDDDTFPNFFGTSAAAPMPRRLPRSCWMRRADPAR